MKQLRYLERTDRSFRSLKGALMFELHTRDAARHKLPCPHRTRR
jgi:hypothetical protein